MSGERDRPTPPAERVTTPDGRPFEEQPRWRHDFPIDAPEDVYVARRDFTKFLVLTSLAFAAGQAWIAVKSLLRRQTPEPEKKRIAAEGDIPVGGALAFHYPGAGDHCLLLRPAEDRFVAFRSECTHLMCTVKPELDQGHLRCPCHHGFFDAQDGRPTAGPPRRPLPLVTLERSGGAIWATGVKLRTT